MFILLRMRCVENNASASDDSIQVKYISSYGSTSYISTELSSIYFLSGTCYTSTAVSQFKIGGFVANRISSSELRGTCLGSKADSSTPGNNTLEIRTMLIDLSGGSFHINTESTSPINMFGDSSTISYYTAIGI